MRSRAPRAHGADCSTYDAGGGRGLRGEGHSSTFHRNRLISYAKRKEQSIFGTLYTLRCARYRGCVRGWITSPGKRNWPRTALRALVAAVHSRAHHTGSLLFAMSLSVTARTIGSERKLPITGILRSTPLRTVTAAGLR